MRKNNEQTAKFYSTLDAYQAGYLTLKGHIPELINQNGKIVFCFTLSDLLLEDLSDYVNGASVEANKFTFAVKQLKSQIHSMRRNNEDDICIKRL